MKNKLNKILVLTARKSLFMAFVVGSLVWGAGSADVTAGVATSFLYTLSNFSGPVPYSSGRVFVDRERNEIYVLYQNSISVFNSSGMEIYRFGDDADLGRIADVAVDREGNILMLTYRESGYEIIRCNFRGEPVAEIEIKNLPPGFSGFSPNRMVYRDGKLYLASLGSKKVIVTTSDGKFEAGYDIDSLLEGLSEFEKKNIEMGGFSVDKGGNILFTLPTLFKAFRLSPDRKMTAFGQPGSLPGKFGVVGGIISDDRGNYLVADKSKSAVMVFDNNYRFLMEFGYRGVEAGSLIRPHDLSIDSQNRVYVTQGAKRGISVFKIVYE
jgi:DNA-binding beta-propeller fold protein YncE